MTLFLILLSSLPFVPVILQTGILAYQIFEHSCEYYGRINQVKQK